MILYGKEYNSAVMPDDEGPVRVVDMGPSKLLDACITVRIFEAQMIEVQAEYFLRTIGIEYIRLACTEAWCILIGAYFAMLHADETGEIRTSRKNDNVPATFIGLLRQSMPIAHFNEIHTYIHAFINSDTARNKIQKGMSLLNMTEFDARIRLLAEVVRMCLTATVPEDRRERIGEGLSLFYSRAKHDYFNEH